MKSFLAFTSALFLVLQLQAQGFNQSRVVAGEYIVKMKATSGSTANASLTKGISLVKKLGNSISVKQAFWGSRMLHVKATTDVAIEILKANPDIEYIEPNTTLSIDPSDVQSLGVAPGAFDDYSQSNSNVQVTESWAVETPYNQGSKTIVAVIDTGLDTTHKLFKDSNALWVNEAEKNGLPGVDDDGNGFVDDIYGWNFVTGNGTVYDDDDHGTHVAGIILGVGQDVLQSTVRESKVQIMPLKFLDGNGSGTTADAVSAMYYAVNMGAKVINNSWGGSTYSRALHDAYIYAHEHGVFIASAAGNSGTNNDVSPMYPAALDTPNNTAVAAATDSNGRASFSNYGLSTVHVAAPGVSIVSAAPGTGCLDPGCFQMMSGTSMASPFVAGLAALIIREAPQLSGYQVRSILMSSVDKFSAFNGKTVSGGRVNALKAIQTAKSQTGVSTYNPAYSPVYKADRSLASEDSGSKPGGCGLVKALGAAGSQFDGEGPTGGSLGNIFVVLALVLLPVLLAMGLKKKAASLANPAHRRQFARYNIAKTMVIKMGDQVLSTATNTLSLGGLSFSAKDIAVDKGAKIKVKIGDLDHEVEGEIVWCSQKQTYGVKFLNISEQLKAQFSMWTAGLSPT